MYLCNEIVKKLCISKFQLLEIFIFWQTSHEKWESFAIYFHNQSQILVYLKKISHRKILFCQHSVKNFCIYHAIQKSNVRKFYIFATLIVKRLEVNWFWEQSYIYVTNHIHKHVSNIQLPKKDGKRMSFVHFWQSNCPFEKKWC